MAYHPVMKKTSILLCILCFSLSSYAQYEALIIEDTKWKYFEYATFPQAGNPYHYQSYYSMFFHGGTIINNRIDSILYKNYGFDTTVFTDCNIIGYMREEFPLNSQCDYLGIDHNKAETIVKIYPNLFQSVLSISSAERDISIKIHDINGNLVYSDDVNTSSSRNLTHLNNGLYLLSIYCEGEIVERRKILKN